jgi:hypothetical protein
VIQDVPETLLRQGRRFAEKEKAGKPAFSRATLFD